MVKKVGILSLGCPRNLVDSENLMGRLKRKGLKVADITKADVAIVNTCAFIKDAKQESIDAILDLIDLKKEGAIKKIIVSGCLVQRYKDILRKELPEVDAFVGSVSLNHSKDRFAITPRHFAYLKICESCTNNCSFCIIPSIKGKFTSIDIGSCIERVKLLNKKGVAELNIVGQDISGYGIDIYKERKLPELARKIVKVSGNIKWIRFLYLYPNLKLIDEFLDVLDSEGKICKYIDLPLQHINDRVLKLMNRHVTKAEILKIIDLIRKKAPAAAIRTSLIVGFPSETDKEFKELLEFMDTVKFDRLGIFEYSREEGTAAFGFKAQVQEKIKNSRFDQAMQLQQEISKEQNKKMFGKVIDVLIDEKDNNSYLGRSSSDAPEVDGTVYLKSDRILKPGDLVKARITDTLEYDLVGEVCNEYRK